MPFMEKRKTVNGENMSYFSCLAFTQPFPKQPSHPIFLALIEKNSGNTADQTNQQRHLIIHPHALKVSLSC